MNKSKSQISIPFNEDFKAIIKEERLLSEVQALEACNTPIEFEIIQSKIRAYLKAKYPDLIQHGKPDYFAVLISLVCPYLEECRDWKDLQFQCLNKQFPEPFWNRKTICACGQSMSSNNSFVISHPDSNLKLSVGSCCIEKNEIVFNFSLIKKERESDIRRIKKKRLRMGLFQARRFFTLYKQLKANEQRWKLYNNLLMRMHETRFNRWNNYDAFLEKLHQERIQKQIQLWADYTAKIKLYHQSSCDYCGKLIKAPYKTCWGCRQCHYDTCGCGKQKKKEYGRCYSCKFNESS